MPAPTIVPIELISDNTQPKLVYVLMRPLEELTGEIHFYSLFANSPQELQPEKEYYFRLLDRSFVRLGTIVDDRFMTFIPVPAEEVPPFEEEEYEDEVKEHCNWKDDRIFLFIEAMGRNELGVPDQGWAIHATSAELHALNGSKKHISFFELGPEKPSIEPVFLGFRGEDSEPDIVFTTDEQLMVCLYYLEEDNLEEDMRFYPFMPKEAVAKGRAFHQRMAT